MKPENYHNDEIDKTLNSLDGLERAQTDPFFLSRLEARIKRESEERQDQMTIWEYLLQPKMSLSLACVLILFNIGFLVWSNNSQIDNMNRSESLQSLATEYSLNSSSYEVLFND